MGSYNKFILFAFMILPLFTGSLAVGGLQAAYGGGEVQCTSNDDCTGGAGGGCKIDTCVGGTCRLVEANLGDPCGDQSSGACDNPNTCNDEGKCKDNFKSSITECRPQAGICDVPETCTGNSASCPVDGFETGGTVCRPSSGVCDVEEVCDGSSASCPVDGFQPAGTACSCNAGSGTCDGNNFCIKNISIDIKPGSDPNSINTRSMGVVPVAILGSDTFDVGDVDETTLMFGNASPAHDLSDPTTYNEHIQDVNDDGFDDLVSHYKQKEIGIACIDTEATLTGTLNDQTPIEGTDSVNPKCHP